MKDKRGITIEVGHTIIHSGQAGRRGHSATVQVGTVKRFTPQKVDVGDMLKFPTDCIIVELPDLNYQ